MSTQVRRVARPARQKAQAEPTPAPTEVAPAEAPVADVAVPVEEPVAETTPQCDESASEKQDAAQPKRQQTSKALGVSISSARVRRHIDKLNLNSNLDSLIVQVKADLETASDDQKHDLGLKVSALSRERTRFSNEASITLSIICDELVQQLTAHTMNKVLAAGKKIIQVSHLHEPGVESLSLYPLVKSLPTFVATADKIAAANAAAARAEAISQAVSQAEKDFKKKWNVKTTKAKKEEAEAAPEAVEVVDEVEVHEEPEDDAVDNKTSFKFYVGQVCKEAIKRDERFKSVRVSTEIRSYLSDLLVEFIKRLSNLVQLTANSMKNKTINDVAILRTVELLLVDNHAPVETVEFREEQVVDPALLKQEHDKRDEARKAGTEYKFDVGALPKVKAYVAVRTVSFPTSGFADLQSKVSSKLSLYGHLVRKDLPQPDEQ